MIKSVLSWLAYFGPGKGGGKNFEHPVLRQADRIYNFKKIEENWPCVPLFPHNSFKARNNRMIINF